MGKIGKYVEMWRAYKEKRHRENVIRRSKEIFTIDDYDGSVWFFCNGIGMFPCSFVNMKSEDEIISFLKSIREFYISTEL